MSREFEEMKDTVAPTLEKRNTARTSTPREPRALPVAVQWPKLPQWEKGAHVSARPRPEENKVETFERKSALPVPRSSSRELGTQSDGRELLARRYASGRPERSSVSHERHSAFSQSDWGRVYSGARAGASSPGQRKAAGKEKAGPSVGNKSLIQLMVCLVIFVVCVLLKTVSPDSAESLHNLITSNVGSGLDYQAALSTLGRVISSGGDISEVFQALSTDLFSSSEEDVAGDGATGSATTPVQAEGDSGTATGDVTPSWSWSDIFGSSGTQTPTYTDVLPIIEGSSGTGADQLSSLSGGLSLLSGASAISPAQSLLSARSVLGEAVDQGGIDLSAWLLNAPSDGWATFPLVLSGWEVSLSAEDSEDDTLPLPFGVELPTKASYTQYALPFAYDSPILGRLSSDFGYRIHPIRRDYRFHYGVDVSGNEGDPIQSFAAGTVTLAANSPSYGKYVIVDHGNGYQSLYAHMSKILVKKGQTVKMGTQIGKVGQTGTATGPHLHFEVRRDAVCLNPGNYMSFVSAA